MKLDKNTELAIVAAYSSGERFMEVVSKYRIGTSTMARIIKRNGLLKRGQSVLRVIEKYEWDEIANSYKRGDTAKEISERYGCSPFTIFQILKSLGIDSRRRGTRKVSAEMRRYYSKINSERWADPSYRERCLPKLLAIGFKPGINHPMFKDGSSSARSRISGSAPYRKFRIAVLNRDGNKCVACNSEKKLHVHHIMPYWKYPELRFDPDNGVSLCHPCHMRTEAYLKRNMNQKRYFSDVLPLEVR